MIDLRHGDCLEVMRDIPDGSVDLVLCDLPYGTTSNYWDKELPLDALWAEYRRIIKDKRAIVLFGAEPFSSMLRMSNLEWFKYDWIWEKNNAVGFVNAKNRPMNKHEVISVFSNGSTANCNKRNMTYNPQGLERIDKVVRGTHKGNCDGGGYGRPSNKEWIVQKWTNYPNTVLHFAKPSKILHPTQKPVAMLEYLIKTYTNDGETVLDNTMGSGSTGVACVNTGRSFIGIEKDDRYFEVARKRIEDAERERKGSLFDMDALDAETERRERESWLFEEDE